MEEGGKEESEVDVLGTPQGAGLPSMDGARRKETDGALSIGYGGAMYQSTAWLPTECRERESDA